MASIDSVVLTLKGISPIYVSECPSGDPTNSGNLQVGINLALGIDNTVDPTTLPPTDTALVSVSGVTFRQGTHVAEIVEGDGIMLTNLSSSSDKKIGRVRISRRDLKYEGEFDSIVLRNAKEVISPVASYIDFLPPVQAPCGITASFKLPNRDLDPTSLKLQILAEYRGDTIVADSLAGIVAIFKVVYHVLRPGFSLANMNDGTAVAIQYWKISFPGAYIPGLILPEAPVDAVNPTLYQIDATTLVAFPGSLVAQAGGFAVGDVFSIQIDRVRQSGDNTLDSYSGRAGILSLRWILL